MNFLLNLAYVFGCLFFITSIWAVFRHLNYNSPENWEKKMDIGLRGGVKKFNFKFHIVMCVICWVYVYTYYGA